MFGDISIIEKISEYKCVEDKIDRLFFTGTLFKHEDKQINYTRDRHKIYNLLKPKIFNPGSLKYESFLEYIRHSKYSLDLNGVGDPNKRTFEILANGSLRLSEYNDLMWPFDDEFKEETIFIDIDDFNMKYELLKNDIGLYNECMDIQNKIVKKYFNLEWIKSYILKHIEFNV
jgi:hypothetical protein